MFYEELEQLIKNPKLFSRLMFSRTYFNLDKKVLFKKQNDKNETEKVKLENKVKETQQNINYKPELQLWDISFMDSTEKIVIENKKKKDSVFFKPGGSFIKEKIEDQKQKSEKEINKEIKQTIRETTKEFFQELKEENQQNSMNQEQQEQQNDNEKNAEQLEQVQDKENINQNKEDNKQGLLKKQIKKSKIENKGNFVRLDLKKQYKDRFRGALYLNQRKYKKNGTLKNQVHTQREQNQIDFQMLNNQGQSQKYNIFIQSVSSGLIIDLFDDEEKPEEIKNTEEDIQNLIHQIQQNLDDKELYRQLLQLSFGYDNFREGQLEAIQSILKNQSILLVQKTGHGKSLVYQFLSLFLENSIGIILSPLISLMIDQISKLPEWVKGIAYHSMLTSFQKEKLQTYLKNKQVKLLFCTPEIFQADIGFQLSSFGKIQFICIDEAHCVSELSHSFRHTYIILDSMIKNFLKDDLPPYLALTATATKQTVESIKEKFEIKESIISIDTERKNIEISISRDRDVNAALLRLLQSQQYSKLNSIIIYCRSRYMVDILSNYLRNSNISCLGFHGALTEQEKVDIQNKFIKNQIRIIVATCIFAMGIDKQDIRAIIHMNLPKSIEAYLQEIGRAGRDGLQSYAHLFLRENDFHLERSFILADNPDLIALSNLFNKIKMRQEQQEITYFVAKYAEENLDLRKDVIFTLMLILEKCSNQSLKVYPMCYEKMILKFFKNLTQEEKEKSTYLSEIQKIGKMINGSLHINVIKASNQLGMQPLEVIRQARNLFTEFYIKVDLQDEILPFQILKPFEENILEETNLIIQMHKKCALDKLNLMYLISYENSIPNIDMLLEGKIKTKYNYILNTYFESNNPYQEILNKLYGNYDINIEEYLPFDTIDEQHEKQIQQAIKRFLIEETCNKNNTESQKLTKFYLNNPKILAKLFCGIQSIKYSYKEYKNSSIWNKNNRLKYEDVQNTIVNLCLILSK